jgi:hypothetical protein
MSTTYLIHNTRGTVVRTTSDLRLARAYVKRMAALGSRFEITKLKVKQETAA